jgi:pimeloyl-ACP methyl ester carboxylesterase
MVDFYYQGQGDVLLFIHGLGSSSAVWKKQLEALKQDYQLITVDLYGHGNNTKTPSDISIKQTAKIISEEIREKELSNITIVGHSLGGLIAIEVADYNKLLLSVYEKPT